VNRVVASVVNARFGDNGLFYAFKTTGAWPSRVRFVPGRRCLFDRDRWFWDAAPLRRRVPPVV
jgi:hypothetical protein